tara:strand:+ start:2986 stop:3735 length:750 start_codon:yes stop_codon:yes gene_type:complete
MSDLELFPTINPNLDEVAEEGENIKVEIEEKQVLKQKDIFDLKHNKKGLKQSQGVQETEVSDLINKDKQSQRVSNIQIAARNSASSTDDKYPHLKEARAKGIITRKEKARIRREEKAEAKRLKDIEKQERRDATKERNRVKARERYRRIKAEKDEKKASEPIDIPRKPQYIPKQERDMSFKQFSNYMMRYEEMKGHYKTYKNKKLQNHKEKTKNAKILQQKPKKEFPDNYPLSHLYGKNRFKPTDFNNF